MDINKHDFDAYEGVRQSGETNMLDVAKVSALSGLDRETILEIIKNYDELHKKYRTFKD